MKTASVEPPVTRKPKPLPVHLPPDWHRRIKSVAGFRGASMGEYVLDKISTSVVADEASMRDSLSASQTSRSRKHSST